MGIELGGGFIEYSSSPSSQEFDPATALGGCGVTRCALLSRDAVSGSKWYGLAARPRGRSGAVNVAIAEAVYCQALVN